MNRFIVPVLAIILASSCSSTKRAVDPQITLPDKVVAELSKDTLCIADMHWSEIFADTLLQKLIKKTLDNNKDLLSATAKVEELIMKLL